MSKGLSWPKVSLLRGKMTKWAFGTMLLTLAWFFSCGALVAYAGTQAPVILNTNPANNAPDVPLGKTIEITFDETIRPGDSFNNITVKDAGNTAVSYSSAIDGSVLTITPELYFINNTNYTVTLPSGAVKDPNNNLAEEYTFSFTTIIETLGPEVISTDPADKMNDFALNFTTQTEPTVTVSVAELVPVINESGGQVTLIVEENWPGALVSRGNNSLTLTLPTGFSWGQSPLVNIESGDAQVQPKTSVSDYGRTLGVWFEAAAYPMPTVSTEATKFLIGADIGVDDLYLAENSGGDIVLQLGGYSKFSPASLVVAQYNSSPASTTGTIAAAELGPANTILAGRLYQEVSPIIIEEQSPGSLNNLNPDFTSSVITLTLPDGLKWSIPEQGDPGFYLPYTSLNGYLSVGPWHFADSTRKTIQGYICSLGDSVRSKGLLTGLRVDVAADFSGEVRLAAAGSGGVAGQAVVAGVIPPIQMQVGNNDPVPDIFPGRQDQILPSLIVRENIAGAILPAPLWPDPIANPIALTLRFPVGVTPTMPNVQVVEGDLLINPDGVYLKRIADDQYALLICVARKSTVPSSIRITNLKVTTNRNLPDGPILIRALGDAVAESGVDFPARNNCVASVAAANVISGQPDTLPPVISITDPANDASNIRINQNVVIVFSEAIQAGEEYNRILLADANDNPVAFNLTINGNTLILDPEADLAYSAAYTAVVPANSIKDLADNPFNGAGGSDRYISFTTQAPPETLAPAIVETAPANLAYGIPVNTSIQIIFDEDVELADPDGIELKKLDSPVMVSLAPAVSGSVLTLDPLIELDYGAKYQVCIANGAIKDLTGNAFAGDVFVFATQPAWDEEDPGDVGSFTVNPIAGAGVYEISFAFPTDPDLQRVELYTAEINSNDWQECGTFWYDPFGQLDQSVRLTACDSVLGGSNIIFKAVAVDYSGNESTGVINDNKIDHQAMGYPVEIYWELVAGPEGWTTFSVPVKLAGNQRVLGDILDPDDVAIAYRFDTAAQYWQQIGEQDLIKPLDAIYVKLNKNATKARIKPTTEITTPPSLDLLKGWNLFGPTNNRDLAATLSAVEGHWAAVVSPSINASIPMPFPQVWAATPADSDLQEYYVANHYGYWLYMNDPDTLLGFNTTPLKAGNYRSPLDYSDPFCGSGGGGGSGGW